MFIDLPNGQRVSADTFAMRLRLKAIRDAQTRIDPDECVNIALVSAVNASRALAGGDLVNGIGEAAVAGVFAERAVELAGQRHPELVPAVMPAEGAEG